MKTLLFGKNGQLGWELKCALAPLGEIIALGSKSERLLCSDFTKLSALAEAVKTIRPDIIVNAAAYTAVDRAETERALAFIKRFCKTGG